MRLYYRKQAPQTKSENGFKTGGEDFSTNRCGEMEKAGLCLVSGCHNTSTQCQNVP